MFRKITMFVIIFMLLFGVFSLKDNKKDEVVTRSTFMLNTTLKISVWIDDESKGVEIIQECFERISEIEKKMSVNIKDSEVSQINKNAQKDFTKVSEDTSKVLNKAIHYAKLSNGAFDPTIGKLLKLWGFGTENQKIPRKTEIDDALKYVDYKLLVKNNKNEFKLENKKMRIDLGGIAKGYAGDEVYKIIKEKGVKRAIIDLGGNILTLGKKMDGEDWKIGIQNPFEPTGTPLGVIEESNKAIVTSGNYERFFVKNKKRYHHIIDSNTGYPSENGIIGDTIITNSSIDADALSTAVYVLGVEKGLALIENIENVECIIVTKDKKVYLSSGMKEKFKIEDTKFQIVSKD